MGETVTVTVGLVGRKSADGYVNEFRVVLDDFAGGPLGELRLVEGCCIARKRQFHKHGLPLEREH